MIDTDPVIEVEITTEPEEELFTSLRAKAWEEFFGQETVKESLLIAIKAAKSRNEPLDHTLLYGPPGLGKTTLSHLISQELGSNIRVTSGTAITKVGDLAAILTNLQPGDILFIDEIHRLPKVIEETLYPAMEDYALDIVIGKGPSARSIRLDLPKFTLVGATTRYGLLAGPFRDRFGLVHRLNYYDPKPLSTIVHNAAVKLNIAIDDESTEEIARRARGTPRIALKILKRVRDFVEVQDRSAILIKDVRSALDMFAIDTMGLEEGDRRLLQQIIQKHNGGPVGLSTLAATLSEDTLTVEEVIEPYLLQIGFLKRTPKGRVVTATAYTHLGFAQPPAIE
jgi:Holliday junction DNA helicase RuvB